MKGSNQKMPYWSTGDGKTFTSATYGMADTVRIGGDLLAEHEVWIRTWDVKGIGDPRFEKSLQVLTA
jgi:hypothetical protein